MNNRRCNPVMVQGTGSGVGKSVITAALCRIFRNDGYKVAPFKAQNMALNSFVTDEGGEIGRSQAVQAMACGIRPSIHHNPILIKPTTDRTAQIIVHGKPVRNMSVYGYKRYKAYAFGKVRASYRKLQSCNDVVVIEGAGSPAEVNLRSHDLVNMRVAKLARAPVILVGDIDKGGVFAWFVGTLALLTADERSRVKAFLINKFRGDKRLLMPGVRFLERYTGIKVLGVVPFYRDIRVPEEDSLPLESKRPDAVARRTVSVAVVLLPHMSNFDDFDALAGEHDVTLRFARSAGEIAAADAIIIPGTKNTVGDLRYLKKAGVAAAIVTAFRERPRTRLIGICGGYQMLGDSIVDARGIESSGERAAGLGILPIRTEFRHEKVLQQVAGRDLASGLTVTGYEIHHGRTVITGSARRAVLITRAGKRGAHRLDGAATADGRCWGTYIHGIFDNDLFRRHFVNELRRVKGWAAADGTAHNPDREIDRLSELVRRNIDMKLLRRIVFGGRGKAGA